MEVNGSKNLEVKNLYLSLESKIKEEECFQSPGSIVRPSIGGCRPPDPGSNPGQGATSIV